MPFFTTESLELLRRRVDLADLVGSHIDLKRAGAAFKACCPFHDEKTPSFTIQKGDSHYHCFGCGAHGDAIQFLMDHVRMNFGEAIESLAQRFGVTLEYSEPEPDQKGPSKARLKESLLQASRLYHFLLLHTAEGHTALQYLVDRGISLDFVRRFRLGYSPRYSGLFVPSMHAKGFDNELLESAGLVRMREGGPAKDFFNERIMFPICDAVGSVIGFSARKFNEETFGGKYVNSAETLLFKKSRVLYGMHECRRRIAKESQAIVVEGQLDALSLIYAGLNLAVAALGTAFGESHATELIDLGVKRIFLAMDADKAGIEAARKVGNLFQKRGVEVKVVRLPVGSDPDSLIKSDGIEGFQALMENAQDYLTFLVEVSSLTTDIKSPAGKTQLIHDLTEQIRQWDNAVMVHESLRCLARLLQVPEEMVTNNQIAPSQYLIRKSASAGLLEINPDRILEADLLRWVIVCGEKNVEFLAIVQQHLTSDDFRVEVCRQIFKSIEHLAANGERWDLLTLASTSPDSSIQELINELLQRRIDKNRGQQLLIASIQKLLDRNWMLKCEDIRMKIQSGQCSDDEALSLLKQFDQLKRNPPKISL